MYNLRGYYTPLTINETLFVSLSKPTQQAWKEVQTRQARLNEAKASVAELQRLADQAPEHDREAAITAVAGGKPVPASTVEASRKALGDRHREIDALTSLTDQAEREFLSLLHGERGVIASTARTSLDAGIQRALDALAAVSRDLEHLYTVNGMWQWGRDTDSGHVPTDWRITARVDGHDEDLRQVLTMAAEALQRARPDTVEQLEADRAAWAAQQRGDTVTADGLVIDAAAYRAYR